MTWDILGATNLTDVAIIGGILFGGGGFIATLISFYKARPETQTLVMSTGETGVKILDNVIDTLREEVERLHAQLSRAEEYMRAQREMIDERDKRIAHDQDYYRELLGERDDLIRALREQLADAIHEIAALRREREGGHERA